MKISAKQLIAIGLSAVFTFAMVCSDAEGPDAGGGQPPAQGPQ